MKKILRYSSLFPALILLLFIFGFSAQNGAVSGSLSYRVCRLLLSLADRVFSLGLSETDAASYAEAMQFFVRKAAHITEYFLLTLSVYLPLCILLPERLADKPSRKSLKKKQLPSFYRYLLLTFLLTLLCATLDEFHQSFVPGRCGTPIDVLIDSIGSSVACILLFLTKWLRHKRKP